MENQIIEKINITPHKSIYHKIGEANYSISDAIAELVDNSIDAANEEGVEIFIILDKNNGKIIVQDDGMGMDKNTAAKSMVLAHSEKHDNLGEFGLGLKSACSSLGEHFIVNTKKYGLKERYFIEYDKEEFLKTQVWDDYPLAILPSNSEQHGTTIEISKLRIKLYDALVTRLKEDLSKRYGPYIKHNNVVIKVGLKKESAKACLPNEPELAPDTRKEFEFTLSNGRKINGWYGILMIGSQRQSGFNLFRRRRLIMSSEKLGYNYHPSLMQITGEINLDSVPVTHNKREFIFESGEFREFIANFWGDQTERFLGRKIKGKIDEIRNLAVARANTEKADTFPVEKRETIKNKILQALNRVDEFKELAFPELKQAKRSSNGELAEKELRLKDFRIAKEEETEKNENEIHNRVPRKTQQNKAKFIMVGGKKFRFDFFLQNLNNDALDKETIITSEQVIEIYINIGFKGYTISRDNEFYAIFHIAEAIAEIYIKEAKQNIERVFSLRNSLIYEVSQIITEEQEFKELERSERELQSLALKKKEMEEKRLQSSL